MTDIDHVTEIDRVLRGAPTGRDGVVRESWRRCVETYGLDPARPDPAHIVTEAELRQHRDQAQRLIAIARSGLQTLFRQVAGHNYVLLLADAKGVCVDFFGDPSFEDELRAAGLYLGSDWSENLAGTCGVGSCIVTGEPVTIHQSDHFGLAHTPLSCTAAPIYDTCGTLAAVLDISLLRSPIPKSSQNIAMNLVTASARRVEMANLMAMTRREWVLRFSTSPEFLEVDPEAAVALDGSGRIIGVTHAAMRMMAPSPGAAALLGRRIDALMEISVDDLPDLMRGRPAEDRMIRLKDGRGLFGHAIAPQSAPPPRRRGDARHPPVHSALSGLAGADPAMQKLLAEASRLAATRLPLLLRGETGTGKRRLARALHVAGAAEPGPFRVFGAAGEMPEAPEQGGTLFVDRAEDLSAEAQARLLSIVDAQDGLRVIASTRADLAAGTGAEKLRDDLFFRLAGVTLALPPLRLRRDFDWLLDRLMRQRGADIARLSPAARNELKARPWPGNIRELECTLEAALTLCEGGVIDMTDLPPAPMDMHATEPPEVDLEALMQACEGNMSRAARRLGVNRSTVLRRLRKAGLVGPVG